MYKNSKKIDELKTEFEKLQQSEDCKFAPDIDGFIDFLAEKIISLEEEVEEGFRWWWEEGMLGSGGKEEVEEFNKQNKATKNKK